jgi:hypothetical protein
LTDVDALTAYCERDIDAVVDQEWDVVLFADGVEFLCC